MNNSGVAGWQKPKLMPTIVYLKIRLLFRPTSKVLSRHCTYPAIYYETLVEILCPCSHIFSNLEQRGSTFGLRKHSSYIQHRSCTKHSVELLKFVSPKIWKLELLEKSTRLYCQVLARKLDKQCQVVDDQRIHVGRWCPSVSASRHHTLFLSPVHLDGADIQYCTLDESKSQIYLSNHNRNLGDHSFYIKNSLKFDWL